MEWEKYKAQPHDHWWANFVRAARIRTEQLRAQFGPDAKITWLVYKQGYIDRGVQEKMNLLEFIDSVRAKFNLNLVYFRNGDDVINYLNNGQPRDQMKVAFLEYFGHSNKACFMFDYSSNVDSASQSRFCTKAEFTGINRRIFARNAQIRSWGCHTGRDDVEGVACGDRHADVGRDRKDAVHERRIADPRPARWQMVELMINHR